MKIVYMHHAERDKSNGAEWGSFERTFDDITEVGKKTSRISSAKIKK